MFIMMVCVNGMFAQTENVATSTDSSAKGSVNIEKEDLMELLKVLSEQEPQQMLPIQGRTKFTRRHHIFQRLEISAMGGSDQQEDLDMDDHSDQLENGQNSDPNQVHLGLNFGYSLGFIPGRIVDDKLRLNSFGFGYSFGFIAAVDSQEKFGATCDFLAKLGVETGYNHAFGIGIDALIGGGTSAVTMAFDASDDASTDAINAPDAPDAPDASYSQPMTDYDTRWCLKYGFQISLRSNLLHANIKNTDVRIFARYIYSVDPTNDNDFMFDGKQIGYYVWSPDSWQIGLSFCHEF